MNTIVVNIYLPILGTSYDVIIPSDPPLHSVLELMKKTFRDLSEGRFLPDDTTVLCRRDDGAILDINKSISESDIRNGSRLMLV